MKNQTENNANHDLLTNQEAADFLRIDVVTLWKLRRSGKIPYSRIGSKLIYRREHLEGLVNRSLQNASAVVA